MQIQRRNWNGLGRTLRRNDEASPNRCYSGHCKATEKDGDQGILEKEIWRKKCGQQDTSTVGGRWRRQDKTELDGDKWSVAYVPLGVTRYKSAKYLVQYSEKSAQILTVFNVCIGTE